MNWAGPPRGTSLAAIADRRGSEDAGAAATSWHPRWITAIYAVLGTAWILGSDYMLGLVLEPQYWDHVVAQTSKGVLFVVITAVSLYLIMRHYAKRVADKHRQLLGLEESFRDYAESASDWFWETGPDLCFTHVSGRFREITGRDPDTLIGKRRDELFTVADAELRRRHVRDLEARRPFRDLVYSGRDDTGAAHVLRISGKPHFDGKGRFLGYRGVGSDVTREFAAHSARERLVAVVEATPDFVGTAAADGKVLFINRAGREMVGLGADEDVSGLTLVDLHPPESIRLIVETAIPEAIETGSWTGRTELAGRSGDTRTVSQVVLAHKGADGAVEYLSTVARDLTAETRAQDRLRRAQKMDALGQLTGGIAHDFNNLLVVILGNAEALVEHLEHDAVGRDLAGTIVQAAERSTDLTRRLLAFSRQQALNPGRVDVGALVASMERLLKRTLGGNVEIETRCAPDLWPALADKGELETCVVNLAVNARDAMPNGGRLTISVANERIEDGDALCGPNLGSGDYVVLSMCDTGVGIPQDIMDKIFEPFFTTKGQTKGNGLGLSMIYGFARQSGGHVSVYSEPGRGTVFHLFLPRAPDSALEARESEPEAALPRGNGESILVVEDEPLVRAYVREQLDLLGYRVEEAQDGPAALVHLEKNPRTDLLVTDMVMPGGLTGEDVAREARRRVPGIKVLFTTGYAGERRGTGAAPTDRLGIEAPVLQKPYRRSRLARIVRETLDAPAAVRHSLPERAQS